MKVYFWWSTSSQKGISVGHFGARDDHSQDYEFLLGNKAVDAGEAIEVAEADQINETAEVSKARKIITEDFSHQCFWIQQFNDNLNITLC